MSIPGITPELADAIIERRKDAELKNTGEISLPQEALNYLSTGGGSSRAFTINSLGHKSNEAGGYAIRATVAISGQDNYRIVYYKSPITIKQ
jgi:hypothetical protein